MGRRCVRVTVLVALGYSLVEAVTEMYEAGSSPETSNQDEFVKKSFSAGS